MQTSAALTTSPSCPSHIPCYSSLKPTMFAWLCEGFISRFEDVKLQEHSLRRVAYLLFCFHVKRSAKKIQAKHAKCLKSTI